MHAGKRSNTLVPYLPLQFKLVGSGSHSPFSIHVVVLGPVSTSPGGQEKLATVPSIVMELSLSAMTSRDLTLSMRLPQFTVVDFSTFM